MKKAEFIAVCPYEIGDKVYKDSRWRTITDICTLHFVKTGYVKFIYEFDSSGIYEKV